MSRSLCKTTVRVFLRVRLFTADQQLKLVRRARIVKVAYPHLQRLFWLWLLRHDDFEGATWIESSSSAGTVSGLQKILELSNPSGCQPPFSSSEVTTLPSQKSYLKVKIPCAVLYSCLVRLESNWTGVKPQEAKGMSTTDLSTPPLVCSFIDGKPHMFGRLSN